MNFFKEAIKVFLTVIKNYVSLEPFIKKRNTEDSRDADRRIALTNVTRLILLSIFMCGVYMISLVYEIYGFASGGHSVYVWISLYLCILLLLTSFAVCLFSLYILLKRNRRILVLIYTSRICYAIIITGLIVKGGLSLIIGRMDYEFFAIAVILSFVPVMTIAEQITSYLLNFSIIFLFCIIHPQATEFDVPALAVAFAISYFIASCNRVLIYKVIYNELEMSRLNARLEMITQTDPLTNLPNRRALDGYFNKMLPKWAGEKVNVSISICDIDNFKNYNDTYSHVAGDEALKSVSRAISENIKNSQFETFFSRIGGEEFVIILAGWIEQSEVDSFYESVRMSVRDMKLPAGKGAAYDVVTISIGFFMFNAENYANMNLNEAYAKADTNLYKAKSAGRDRICNG